MDSAPTVLFHTLVADATFIGPHPTARKHPIDWIVWWTAITKTTAISANEFEFTDSASTASPQRVHRTELRNDASISDVRAVMAE